MNENNNKLVKKVDKILNDLFPLNRSLTGSGVLKTFEYIKKFLPDAKIKYLKSGTKVFDWTIPEEWEVKDAYVINSNGEKIIDFKENNLHLVSYSSSIDKIVEKEELLQHLHALPKFPDRTPANRTKRRTCRLTYRVRRCISGRDRHPLDRSRRIRR